MTVSREIVIRSFPVGALSEDDFELVKTEIPTPSDGEVLIKNIWLSIEAGQRIQLSSLRDELEHESIRTVIPTARPGQTMPGHAVGQIIESRNSAYPVGSFVLGWLGWREYLTSDGTGLQILDTSVASPQSYLGTMGLWGATAYYGLLDIGKIKPGETVVVSTAAGSVGIVAVQIAKIHHCRVVGITGSDEKAAWLVDELGVDAAINYKTASDLTAALRETCPEGIDLYLDHVGGTLLEAAIEVMKLHGRILVCGQVTFYDGGTANGPRNYFSVIAKRLTIRGFTVVDFVDRLPAYQSQMVNWLAEKKIIDRQTAYDGIENAPRAWIDLLAGKNVGKMVVQLNEPISQT
jgi:NADPH-dependent curcumin reductase CurA